MKKWTIEEENKLKELFNKGYKPKEIIIIFKNRTTYSIKNKLSKLKLLVNRSHYYKKVKCLNCNKIFEAKKSNIKRGFDKFCSSSCSAKYNNIRRLSYNVGIKILNCSICNKKLTVDLRTSVIHCKECRIKRRREKYKLKKRFCKSCNSIAIEKNKIYCNICIKNYYSLYRPSCKFKFSLNDYPKEFDFTLIKENGWYSPTNKNNNLTGVSRDHMFSVRNGFELGIAPNIIGHPANCRLMLHTDNSSKNKQNSISLEELIDRIKYFEKIYYK